MDLYLPIAGLSVNVPVIVLLGFGVGFLSGMLGVGGGFLTTPLLIFYGVPPAVAVASSAPQIMGSSVSGMLSHWRTGGVDRRMGAVLVAGGFAGSFIGSRLFEALKRAGQTDSVISIAFVLLLGGVGALMLRDSIVALRGARRGEAPRRRLRTHNPLFASLPGRMRFYGSGIYLSPLGPFLIGLGVGVLTVIMGIGGGFILVPAMIYLLGIAARVVVGTSLFQIVFVTAATTMVHAVNSGTVDIVLAALLLGGGVVGAQYGASAARRLPADKLRLLLALVVLGFALRLAWQLTIQPPSIYSVEVVE